MVDGKRVKLVRFTLASALLLLLLWPVAFLTGSVASLSNTYIRLNRLETGQTTSFRFVFTTGVSGATTASINFNGTDVTTWTGSSGVVNTTQTISSASCAADTGATALPGSLNASGSGSTVSITGITALSASTAYCVDLTSATAVTTPAVGTYHPTITVGAETISVALDIIANDQIVVSAAVPATFSLTLDSNTTSFTTNLDPTSVAQTTGRTATIATNATNGWIMWAKDSNTGLTSTTAGHTITSTTPGTAATLASGTEGYVISSEVTSNPAGGGTDSIPAAYVGNSGNSKGSGLDTTYRQIADSNGPANNDVITVRGKAAISNFTPAANDYTDTWTLIGAGLY